MDVVSSVSALIGAINGTRQILGSAIDSRDQGIIDAAVLDVRERLSNAVGTALDVKLQQIEFAEMYSAIQQKVHALETENAELKTFKADFARYGLKEIRTGVNVFALKENEQAGEPMHYLCPNCYTRGEKSILVRSQTAGSTSYMCYRCKFSYRSDEPGHGKSATSGLAGY